MTELSKSLIDLCITNTPDKIVHSDVLQLGIIDHSLVYVTRKTRYVRCGTKKIIEKRSFKNFNKTNFVNDLRNKEWNKIALLTDPNEMWTQWKALFVSCLDKHAPLRHKIIGNKCSHWINNDLIRKMHKRDFLKNR